jgi:hypothetical protein
MRIIKSIPHIEPDRIESFLIDLNDDNFRMLTMAELALHVQVFGKALKEE